MVSPRAPLSKLTAGLLFVSFLIYLVIINRLEVGQSDRVADPASFSSRMLMNLPSSGSGDGNNLHDTISNSGVITAIDNMVNQIGVAGSDLTETRVKDISNEIAKQIADYVVQRLGKAATISNPCSSCWKHGNATDLPVIYLVTPTYRRPEQIPDLTRLAQTLLNVPAVHWIVVEDNSALSPAIASLLKRYGIPHTHLKETTWLLKIGTVQSTRHFLPLRGKQRSALSLHGRFIVDSHSHYPFFTSTNQIIAQKKLEKERQKIIKEKKKDEFFPAILGGKKVEDEGNKNAIELPNCKGREMRPPGSE